MDSQADWDAVMHPAPTMGQTRPFSPPEAFWKRNSLLVLTRGINSGGDDLDVFQVGRVVRSKSKFGIVYKFHRLQVPHAARRLQPDQSGYGSRDREAVAVGDRI